MHAEEERERREHADLVRRERLREVERERVDEVPDVRVLVDVGAVEGAPDAGRRVALLGVVGEERVPEGRPAPRLCVKINQ